MGPRLVLVKGIRVCRECSTSLLERSVNCYSEGLERERARKQEERRFFFPNFCCHLDLTSSGENSWEDLQEIWIPEISREQQKSDSLLRKQTF